MYVVLVTGTREWPWAVFMEDALKKAWREAGYPEDFVIRHGAARGADTLADGIATRQGWLRDPHPVTPRAWKMTGGHAGILRNQHMVNLGADECIAFIRSHSAGATGCADLAEAAGILTTRYFDCPCHEVTGEPK